MMRNSYTGVIAGVMGALVLTALAAAQGNQNTAPHSPWKYYPADRAIGDGGPAPKRDLSGTWAGPSSGAGAPRQKNEVPAPMTPLGKQLYDRNKPIGKYSPGGTNDPHTRYCDPFGFPQNMTNEIRGMTITPSWWRPPDSPRRPGRPRAAIPIASMRTYRNGFAGTVRTI